MELSYYYYSEFSRYSFGVIKGYAGLEYIALIVIGLKGVRSRFMTN